MLEIVSFVLGPVQTNAYLAADPQSGDAVAIDPAWDGQLIWETAQKRGWRIKVIWLTHAHFDHIGGAGAITQLIQPAPPVALHPADLPLYQMQGGAPLFGMRIDPPPPPSIDLSGGQSLELGSQACQVRHTPGHTPGHVVFYFSAAGVVFCGDVIFSGSIGRTDLPGGSYETLVASIRDQIFDLPDTTRLLSGHGPETTVGIERIYNPFVGAEADV
jgi:glyoxylase-like metal-dependent hydrolase (beta-lactamase superfamily II)